MSLSSLLDLVPRPAVDELSRLGLLSLSPRLAEAGEGGVTVDLAHALYAEAVRSGVPRARRREVLERVAAMTHDGRRGGADLVRSVTLALDSDVQVAPARLDAAVQTAFELEQPQTAARLLSAALRQLPVGDARRAPLLLQRADAWWHADDAALAQRDLAEVFDALWSTPEPDVATVRLMIAATAMQASLGHFRRGDIADAMVPFDAAERWIVASRGPACRAGPGGAGHGATDPARARGGAPARRGRRGAAGPVDRRCRGPAGRSDHPRPGAGGPVRRGPQRRATLDAPRGRPPRPVPLGRRRGGGRRDARDAVVGGHRRPPSAWSTR